MVCMYMYVKALHCKLKYRRKKVTNIEKCTSGFKKIHHKYIYFNIDPPKITNLISYTHSLRSSIEIVYMKKKKPPQRVNSLLTFPIAYGWSLGQPIEKTKKKYVKISFVGVSLLIQNIS